MSIKSELLELAADAASRVAMPAITDAYIPEPDPGAGRHTEFGILALADGAAGLYYAWLGDSQRGMAERFSEASLRSRRAEELAALYAGRDEAECSIGLAAISAITHSIYRRAGYEPAPAPDSTGALAAHPGDHIGMVGYFPPLVARLREQDLRLTVIEQTPRLVQREGNFEVTLDAAALGTCNKVLITAATLLNDTIEDVLAHTARAGEVIVLGPTAGFFPDPLFARGVTGVAGTWIDDPAAAIARQRSGEPMGDSTHKTLVRRDEYPGFNALVAAVARAASA
ncbi:MAG TPA: DUF364 domain-containing protein [Arenicellales bacterium]|nr:DUF364 domain-containing protein [Arenicellales bacterium]